MKTSYPHLALQSRTRLIIAQSQPQQPYKEIATDQASQQRRTFFLFLYSLLFVPVMEILKNARASFLWLCTGVYLKDGSSINRNDECGSSEGGE